MKNFILFFVLFPVLLFGQTTTDLVVYNSSNLAPSSYVNPNILLTYHVEADNAKNGSDLTMTFAAGVDNLSAFALKGVKLHENSLQANSYIEFNVSPKAGHFIKLENFLFSHKLQHGTAKYQVRYSKNSNFSNYVNLNSGVLNTSYSDVNVDLSNQTLLENDTLYIRIYYFSIVSNWGAGNVPIYIKRDNDNTYGTNHNSPGPRFRGEVYQSNGLAVYQDIIRWDNITSTVINQTTTQGYDATRVGTSLAFTEWGTANEFLMVGNDGNVNQNVNLNRYVEFKVSPKEGYQMMPDYFSFNYRMQAESGKIQVRASKNPNLFNTNGSYQLLVPTTTISNTSYINNKSYFSGNLTHILPGETLYVRIYFFASNNNLHLEVNAPLQKGPRIAGNATSLAMCSQETVWNGTTWSNGVPDFTKRARLTGNYNTNSNGNFKACVLVIDAGKTLTIGDSSRKDASVIVRNEIVNNGKLIVTNNANLIQINDNAFNEGEIIYQRITNPVNNVSYVYWGSPVKINLNSTNGGLKQTQWKSETSTGIFNTKEVLSPSNFYWDARLNNAGTKQRGWAYHQDEMIPGQGYIIKAPNSPRFPSITQDPTKKRLLATFEGKPNNGEYIVPIVTNNSTYNNRIQLISNPYPGSINVDQFILDHNQQIELIEPTVYFWTHQNNPVLNQNNVYSYSADDYAIYSLTGGVSASKGAEKPSGNVASGQGFLVTAKPHPISEVKFSNKYRYSGTEHNPSALTNNTFYRNTNSNEKGRFWLNINGANNLFKQTLIGYVPNGTNDEDALDGVAISSSNPVDIYTIVNNKKLAIQSRALPFSDSEIVPIAYKVSVAGTYTIELDETDGLFANQDIFIKDNVTGTIERLQDGEYSFVSQAGTFEDRFEIHFYNETFSTIDFDINNNWIVFQNEGKLNIQSIGFDIKNIEVYDITGRSIFNLSNVNSNKVQVPNVNSKQILIVKITSTENVTSTKKVLN